ncbi:MAG: transcription antitermination factor NusB [Acidobacteriota bacterium]
MNDTLPESATLVEEGEAQPAEKPLGKRRAAREMALRMLYQLDLGGSSLAQIFGSFDVQEFLRMASASKRAQRDPEAAFAFSRKLVEGTVEHLEEIDRSLDSQATNWRLQRMSKVDRNVLRLALYELRFEKDTPKLVVVDEAIELAKRYGDVNSGRFVNGLLDGLLKGEGKDHG